MDGYLQLRHYFELVHIGTHPSACPSLSITDQGEHVLAAGTVWNVTDNSTEIPLTEDRFVLEQSAVKLLRRREVPRDICIAALCPGCGRPDKPCIFQPHCVIAFQRAEPTIQQQLLQGLRVHLLPDSEDGLEARLLM